jgi:prepilin-type N-terminal cleavage/methylation domain-containing protein
MQNKPFRIQNSEFRIRPAFTLTEMLLVVAIIGIMTGLALSALQGATELAREQRTRTIIAKIDQLIMERYESYRTRAVPVRVPVSVSTGAQGGINAARIRLYGLRDLMRMEMPDRITDLVNGPAVLYSSGGVTVQMRQPSLWLAYRRMAQRACGASWSTTWTTQHEGSECLYLILSSMQDGDKNALDYLSSDEIGDTDEDGMREILDAWGTPIEFLRWPAGFTEHPGNDGQWGVAGRDDDGNGTVDDLEEAGWPGSDDHNPQSMQTRNYNKSPDPFDPLKVDPRWASGVVKPYALHPLIFSAGRDKLYDITVENSLAYYQTTPPNDPYYMGPSGGTQPLVGRYGDANGDGVFNYIDNITNHNPITP